MSMSDADEGTQLEIPELGVIGDVVVTRVPWELRDDEFGCAGVFKHALVVGPGSSCEIVLFHLPNFYDVMGDVIRDGSSSWSGRLSLESADLRVAIDARAPRMRKRVLQEVKALGGFALTHTGSLEKIDGSAMSPEEAIGLCSDLYFFLSFVRGFWCGPALSAGFGGGVEAWRSWGSRVLTPYRYVESWFPWQDNLSGNRELSDAFKGYMRLRNAPLWSSALKEIVHWYVVSNIGQAALEGSIVLTQAALEMLCWLYLVEDPRTAKFDKKAFEKPLSAAAKIRALLGALDIPTDIPSEMKGLGAFAGTLTTSIKDGPAAFATLRNALVHPRKHKRAIVDQTPVLTRMEAKDLGLWYVEMVLLHLFGYMGHYYRRWIRGTWADEARALVPWV
jgi:hypothetical protein